MNKKLSLKWILSLNYAVKILRQVFIISKHTTYFMIFMISMLMTHSCMSQCPPMI